MTNYVGPNLVITLVFKLSHCGYLNDCMCTIEQNGH